jgi:hypothetical protein
MFQDPEAYPEPHLFKPERYLTEDGRKINPDVRDPRDIVFGFGRRYVLLYRFCPHSLSKSSLLRRGEATPQTLCYTVRSFVTHVLFCSICPGRFMAFTSIWTAIAGILATLDIQRTEETVLNDPSRYFAPALVK